MNRTEPHLVWVSAGGGQRPLQDPTFIGRAADNTVMTEDMGCSSKHAVIRKENDCWVIQDLGSRNGTWLNGQRVEDMRPLKDGDAVQVGSQTFRLVGLPPDLRCPKCGAEPPSETALCPACGYALTHPPPSAAAPPSPLHPPKMTALPPLPGPRAQTPTRRGLGLGAVVILILIVVAGFFLWKRSGKSHPQPGARQGQQAR